MNLARTPHHRGFIITVVWTLGLIWLGSVVHATESSLACPDWPTCYGEWMPAMEGGIFWEHLHRLVAGGLVLIFLGATYLAWRDEGHRPWIWKVGVGGIFLLLVQSVLGGVTVIMELPTAISTAHLTLALLFLAMATVLMVGTSPAWGRRGGAKASARHSLEPDGDDRGNPGTLRRLGWATMGVTGLVLAQSLLGGLVRHMDAALACPDIPLCHGQWVPPLDSALIAVHYFHRIAGVLVAVAVLALAWRILQAPVASRLRKAAYWVGALVVTQVLLGFMSVYLQLEVLTVSFHTLVAALLVTILAAAAVWLLEPAEGQGSSMEGRVAPETAVGDEGTDALASAGEPGRLQQRGSAGNAP